MSWRKYIGPGPLVAAAFIGPGTVTVCTMAGVNFGIDLLWALLLSVIATVVLQEMAVRIGLVTKEGLAAVITRTVPTGISKFISVSVILVAIVIGNSAYEAGNIAGGAMGLEIFFNPYVLNVGQYEFNIINFGIGIIALALLLFGNFRRLTQVLTFLVILMSLAFLYTAFKISPNMGILITGFSPNINHSNVLTVVALIGTTVVPYNLFLHSSLVSKTWSSVAELKYARIDTFLSVILGGLVSMAILITASQGNASSVQNAADLANGLTLSLGMFGKYLIGIGLFAAGITSAITAPLAGSIVVCDLFGWPTGLQNKQMKLSIIFILGLGLFFASLGIKPVQLIAIAQVANGFLLPILSGYILWLVNKRSLMKGYHNTMYTNLIAVPIWLITVLLGYWILHKVLL
ncbi:Nramp family divalent metal transporter [Belliella sp. DSM 111904]|uniref:Nramp family divalent metal transporter n=1 Tax=Belliella filtrata TaxID=2923435 RepID=A0ABS9V093_9BACT|nr:Nramp family divalent metal transporter [Belliella filtrata]MCH7409418.1 Nramp family divalent metal transporter [Belliella filtrata]